MTLHEPFRISSRLLPSVRIADATLSLDFVGCADNRMVFRWFIDIDGGGEYSAADLKSGTQGCDTQAMFGTFLAFLSACGESYRYAGLDGENSDLFPPEVAEWAAQNSDEIDSVRCEIEDTPGLIEE